MSPTRSPDSKSTFRQSSSGGELEPALWETLGPGWRPKGYNTHLNRFFAMVEKTSGFLLWWLLALCRYDFLGLKSGLFGVFGDTRVAKPHFGDHRRNQDGTDAGTSADASRVNVADRALRGCAQNCMDLSAVILGNPWHNSLARAVGRISRPLHVGDRWQSHLLRSSAGASIWLKSQLVGAFIAVIHETCEQLSAPGARACRLRPSELLGGGGGET